MAFYTRYRSYINFNNKIKENNMARQPKADIAYKNWKEEFKLKVRNIESRYKVPKKKPDSFENKLATDKSSSSSSKFKVPLKKPNSVKNKGKKSNGSSNNAKLLKRVRDKDK
tara:strand:- start:3746 stop:4081 length:336 start_codon:yes stop_codon:yes gene_type:complete